MIAGNRIRCWSKWHACCDPVNPERKGAGRERDVAKNRHFHTAEIANLFAIGQWGALVSSHNEHESVQVLRQRVATPDHVQIWPDKKIVEAVDVPRCLAIDIERRER